MKILLAIGLAVGAWLVVAPALAQTPPPAAVNANPAIVRVEPGREPVCASDAQELACVVARFYACAAAQDAALCAQLGLGEIPKLVETPQPIEFLIERSSVIEAKDVTDDLKHLSWFRAGHVLVEAQARRCPLAGSCDGEEWDDWQIYIRRDEGLAQIVYWRGDSEPDQPPEIPDSFRAPAPVPQTVE